MAVIIPTGYAQVTLNWQHSESERIWSTVIGVDSGIAVAADVSANMIAAWTVALQPVTDNSLSLVSVTTTMGPNFGPAPGITFEESVLVPGTNPMTGAPANCTVLVRKFSALGGRANRGRNYWPGMVADGQVDEVGRLDEAVQIGLQEAFTEFYGLLGSGGGGGGALTPAVILHDSESPTTDPSLIVAVLVERVIGTQRRRIRP